jgi:hypothetical protein
MRNYFRLEELVLVNHRWVSIRFDVTLSSLFCCLIWGYRSYRLHVSLASVVIASIRIEFLILIEVKTAMLTTHLL